MLSEIDLINDSNLDLAKQYKKENENKVDKEA